MAQIVVQARAGVATCAADGFGVTAAADTVYLQGVLTHTVAGEVAQASRTVTEPAVEKVTLPVPAESMPLVRAEQLLAVPATSLGMTEAFQAVQAVIFPKIDDALGF